VRQEEVTAGERRAALGHQATAFVVAHRGSVCAYTTDVVDPSVGGGKGDLPYLERIGGADGEIARRKLNFGNTTARVLPLSARFGVTLTF
jgi:hypothetical protein